MDHEIDYTPARPIDLMVAWDRARFPRDRAVAESDEVMAVTTREGRTIRYRLVTGPSRPTNPNHSCLWLKWHRGVYGTFGSPVA